MVLTPRPIDVLHMGRDRVICCWQVGDVLVDPGPESAAEHLLAALGDAVPRVLALTHVHLDHAGAAGALVRRWPHLEVWVHERGAPHMIDPSKLVASATRIWGEREMESLWGEIVPVPEDNLRVLTGGESLDGFEVAYTPGHASHHVSYLHSGSGHAFVGDVAGVRIPPSQLTVAPTPPPDIDLELWNASIDTVAAWEPRALGITHFGAIEDPLAQLQAVRESLSRRGEWARTLGEDGFVEQARAEVLGADDSDTNASEFQAADPVHQYGGLARYWSKRQRRAEHEGRESS